MAIETDKHVKIMLDKLERIAEVTNIELYIQLEPRAVWQEDIQQKTTSLQVTIPDAQYEYSTHVEDDDVHADRDTTAINNDDDNDDDDYVDENIAINDEYFAERDEYEDMIGRGDFGDFERDIDDDETLDGSEPYADNVISVQNIANTIPAHAPPTFSFNANTWKNMVDSSHIEMPFVSTWREGMNLCKGLTFANKEEVKRILTNCALKENKHFTITRSTTKKLCAKCVHESCKWYVYAAMKPNLHQLWMVTVYVGPHMCVPIGVQNDSRMMSCNFIASDIHQKLCEDHTTPVKHLRSMIETKYNGHKPSYYKIWDAKQKGIAKMFRKKEESYQRLQKLLMAYIDQDPTTQVFYRITPTDEDDIVLLHYVFWSFDPCISGFKYCKPAISIDGTHLYGKYQGKLLVSMAIDANNKVFPLAFVVVDWESGCNWRWFLQCLREAIGHVIPNEGICIIFDRHLGIKNAIANWPRRDDGRTRVKIEAIRNKKKVTGKDGKEKNQDYLPYIYLMSKFVDMWTPSHDGGRCFGAMTTNISECFNSVLKGTRGLPIAALVEFTWNKLVQYFHDRRKEYHFEFSESKKWSAYALSTWGGNKRKYEKHYLKPFSNEELIFQVVTQLNTCSVGGGNHSYEVRLQERTCSCGKWQNIGIPCSYAIRVCDYLHIYSTTYIHPCYGLNNALNTYEHAFVVPKSQSLWRDHIRPKWLPNPALLRAKGRPVKSRIRNEMDGVRNKDRELGWRVEDADLIESQPKQTCGLCHASRHNRKKCL
nr:uncharacterized protein LOC112010632 [Quercus suber]